MTRQWLCQECAPKNKKPTKDKWVPGKCNKCNRNKPLKEVLK